MSALFVDYIKILGKGRHGARSLTEQEAEDAMGLILKQEVAPEQMGAFWMLIRIREETAEEAAGFTRAVRKYLNLSAVKVDLDWPVYAGKRNELPWFLLAAFALAQSGIKIVMHGHKFEDNRIYVEAMLNSLGLPICSDLQSVEAELATHNFAYIPLNSLSKELADLMNLKHLLGLRSPVNTVVRLMNPFAAMHSVHGVFHKNYDVLHIETAKLLQDPSVLVFRGGNGEAEINPERDVSLGYLKGDDVNWLECKKTTPQHIRQKDNLDLARLKLHWAGEAVDGFGDLAVIQTLSAVIRLIGNHQFDTEVIKEAHNVWQSRDKGFVITSGYSN